MKNKSKLFTIALITMVYLSCNNDDETPNQSPVIEAQTFSVNENTTPGQSIGTVAASDPDGDVLSFSITQNANGLFGISSSGEVSLVTGQTLDYESATQHEITVSVSDGDLEASNSITLNVQDDDEAPTAGDQTFSVDEDVSEVDILGTVAVSDPENGSLSFEITQNANDLFVINSSGEVQLATGMQLDYETETSHQITVRIADATSSIDVVVTFEVENVNEPPVIETQSFNVYEAMDGVSVGTLVATDPEDDTLTFSIATNSNGLFEINANGDLKVVDGQILDYETLTSHGLAISVGDGEFSSSADIVVDVDDLDTVVSTVATIPYTTMSGLAYNATDNYFLCTDPSNEQIIRINLDANSEFVNYEVVAGGNGAGFQDGASGVSQYNNPYGIGIYNGDALIADLSNSRIRQLNLASNQLTITYAGNGTYGGTDGIGMAASFGYPAEIAIDETNDIAYIIDNGDNKIRVIDLLTATVSTLAGSPVAGYTDGSGTMAQFNSPFGATVDSNGDLFVADRYNQVIRKVTPAGVVTTVAGTPGVQGHADGASNVAQFDTPHMICVDDEGNLYVSDLANRVIRKIDSNGNVSTIAGLVGQAGAAIDGAGHEARLNSPEGIIYAGQNTLYFLDSGNRSLRKIIIDN